MAPGGSQDVDPLDDVLIAPDDLDDLDHDHDHDHERVPDRRAPRRRRAVVAVIVGAVVVVGGVAAASPLLRSPQERLESRLTDAVEASGAELAAPVRLSRGGDSGGDSGGDGGGGERGGDDGDDPVWTGRLQLVDGSGTSVLRVAVRLPPEEPDDAYPSLFPQVDCDQRFPLTWPGDSDSSYRTTRDDLAECVSTSDGDGVLVTVGWRDRAGGDGGEAYQRPGVDRQTWRTDGAGGLFWLRGAEEGTGGLTGEQQRAVASADGLLERL